MTPTDNEYTSIEVQTEKGLLSLSDKLNDKQVSLSLQVRLLELAKIVYEHLAFHNVCVTIDSHNPIDLWTTVSINEPLINPNGGYSGTIDVKIFQINITEDGSDLYARWNQIKNGYEIKFNIKGEFEYNRQELGYFLENAKVRYENAKLSARLDSSDSRIILLESQLNSFKDKMKQTFNQLQYI